MTMPAMMTRVMMMTIRATKTMIMIDMMTASASSQFSHSSWPAWLCEKLQEKHQDSDLAHLTTVYLFLLFPVLVAYIQNELRIQVLSSYNCLVCLVFNSLLFGFMNTKTNRHTIAQNNLLHRLFVVCFSLSFSLVYPLARPVHFHWCVFTFMSDLMGTIEIEPEINLPLQL